MRGSYVPTCLSTRTLKAAYRFAACNTPTVSAPSLACLLLLLLLLLFFFWWIHSFAWQWFVLCVGEIYFLVSLKANKIVFIIIWFSSILDPLLATYSWSKNTCTYIMEIQLSDRLRIWDMPCGSREVDVLLLVLKLSKMETEDERILSSCVSLTKNVNISFSVCRLFIVIF